MTIIDIIGYAFIFYLFTILYRIDTMIKKDTTELKAIETYISEDLKKLVNTLNLLLKSKL